MPTTFGYEIDGQQVSHEIFVAVKLGRIEKKLDRIIERLEHEAPSHTIYDGGGEPCLDVSSDKSG